ncbi:D-alanyl-D-alanine carboxypeptidase [Nonomuraea pusilla]|uniref:D-alanyl-D-alanine carboxypeptidase n=1 Tax=Nonomuraea pusilla TaxID=46177 RepID=A0A1H7JBS4_9ACTN|nr:D-alanyl-D-alanine carboxypeptidase [Nonomuraea pusilla]
MRSKIRHHVQKSRVFGAVLAGVVLGGGLAAPAHARTAGVAAAGRDTMNAQLRCVLDGVVTPPVPGAILSVTGPGRSFEGAAGVYELGGRALRTSDAFRTASVTKTMTAAVALRLAERGDLRLDAPIGRYLDRKLVARIPNGSRITVRQLLDHTAGVYDYVSDEKWFQYVLDHPQKTWKPRELVDWALRSGKPYFAPGRGYHYSDTGYVLAGLIIEKAGRRPLHQLYRSMLLRPLKMDRTYLEWWEAHRGPRAHNYLAERDTYDFNPTFDTFGGGGLVSTAADLNRFMRGLFEGKVFKRPATLRTMLRVTPQSVKAGSAYGLGMSRMSLAGETVYGHNGFFGALQVYVPKLRVAVTGTLTQAGMAAKEQSRWFIENALLVSIGKPPADLCKRD